MNRIPIMFYTYSIVFCLIAAFFLPRIFFVRVLAKEEYKPKIYKYYTSIVVEKGDTLWDIANQYITPEYGDISEYIGEVKYLNHLRGDEIHAGEYLTIPYYSDDIL